MAGPYYVDSVGGSNSNDGSTYLLRKKYLDYNDGAAGLLDTVTLAAGDVIRVTHNHEESISSSVTWVFANGTISSPITVVSVDSTDMTSYQVASTTQFTFTSTNSLNLSGSGLHFIGLSFDIGGDFKRTTYTHKYVFEHCTFAMDSLWLDKYGGMNKFVACTLEFGNSTYAIYATAQRQLTEFISCTFNATAMDASDYLIFHSSAYEFDYLFDGCDFSNAGVRSLGGVSEPPDANKAMCNVAVRNCRLATGQGLMTSPLGVTNVNSTFEMSGCYIGTDTDPSFQYHRITNAGEITEEEATILATDPSSDGTTEYAWEMVSVAGATNDIVLETAPITRWLESIAAAQTVTIYFTSTVTLNKAEFWVELLSPSEAATATAQARWQTSKADFFATDAFSTTAGAWDAAKTYQYKIEFTDIDPTEHGLLTARCYLAKASATVVVDPRLHVAAT